MRGWSARQCCSGGCCDVLGMPVSLGCKKEAIAAEKSMEKQASVHQHCRGSGSAPRASLPRAHWGPDPQGSASVGLSSLRRKLETHLSVSLSHLYRVHLPPWPSCLCCPPPALLRGGRHSFPSCESSSLAFPLLCQVITSLRGEPRALPALLCVFPACCYLLLGGIRGRNAACPREGAAAARAQQAKFSSWLCQGSPL